MSRMVMCDRCNAAFYADSRSNKGDYCGVNIDYIDGMSSFHLCRKCHKELWVSFLGTMSADEYDDEFGKDEQLTDADSLAKILMPL